MKTNWPLERIAALLSWAFLFVVLGVNLSSWLRQAAKAVAFPFELDYGEGIVWEQARLLFSKSAYAPIDQFPSIVFHYPPIFHTLCIVLSRVLGADMLATGRAVSLGSTVVVAIAAGVLTGGSLSERGASKARLLAGLATSLIIFTCLPVMMWSPLMRVDMTALMFSFAGLALGIRAVNSEPLIYWSALFFVLAVFTKQTSVAAPAALFVVLLWLRPRVAIRGIAVCLGMGVAAVAGLNWFTAGGFVRHVVLYNMNRFDWERLLWIVVVLYFHAIYFVVVFCLLYRVRTVAKEYAGLETVERKTAVAANSHHVSQLVLIVYWIIATFMTLTVAKSGASVNYLMEWMCVTTLLVGFALSDAARTLTSWRIDPTRPAALTTCIVPLAVGLQVLLLLGFSPASYERAWTKERIVENENLSARIRAADKPIISDNMVILLRNNRPVLWEPAIFAELASRGTWDEEPFVDRIRRCEFAMFITVGSRGTPLFDSRYNPRIADAIDDMYPIKENLAGYTLNLPR